MSSWLRCSKHQNSEKMWTHDETMTSSDEAVTQFCENMFFFSLKVNITRSSHGKEITESGCGMQWLFSRFVGADGRQRRKKSCQRFPFRFAMEKCFFVFLCNNLITSQLPHPKELSSRWDNSLFVSLFLLKSAPAYENEGENEERPHVTDTRNYLRALGWGKGLVFHMVASPKYMWTSIKGKMSIYHSLLA